MKLFKGFATAFASIAFAVLALCAAWWLVTQQPAAKSEAKPAAAASVDKPVKEEELDTVTLSDEAEKRIGLIVAPMTTKAVQRVRVYGGEVLVPAGRAIVVSAPLSGVLNAAPSGEVTAGQAVKKGQVIFQLAPILTPDGRATMSAALADADGLVDSAKAQVRLTTIALDRAKRVLRDGAGSQRQVDEAEAAHQLAVESLEAAMARQKVLNEAVGQAETASPIPIEAPEGGVMRVISALPGQNVPSGTALFEVIDISTIWLRVPIPAGDAEFVERTAPAAFGTLSARSSADLPRAMPASAPPSANPLSATVDFYYEAPNPKGKLIPGQRVGVFAPLTGTEDHPIVPWSAVVLDIHGGAWVYERLEERRYVRRRVQVEYTAGADAVLASGPPDGAMIVVAGAQQLFGAETGFVK